MLATSCRGQGCVPFLVGCTPHLVAGLPRGVDTKQWKSHAFCIGPNQLMPHCLIHVAVQLVLCVWTWCQVRQGYDLHGRQLYACGGLRPLSAAPAGCLTHLVTLLCAQQHIVARVFAPTAKT